MQNRYGLAPKVVGKVDAVPSEFLYTVYLPIKMPDSLVSLPENLQWTSPIVIAALADYGYSDNKYIYLTAKHMFVEGYSGNRPGWHSDGFMSRDINYIWYDCVPTEFCVQDFWLSPDHKVSLAEMESQATTENIRVYPDKSLLMLDQYVIHRAAKSPPCIRTFVKVSFSGECYNLQGNAHNYNFDYRWEMMPREMERNDTSKPGKKAS